MCVCFVFLSSSVLSAASSCGPCSPALLSPWCLTWMITSEDCSCHGYLWPFLQERQIDSLTYLHMTVPFTLGTRGPFCRPPPLIEPLVFILTVSLPSQCSLLIISWLFTFFLPVSPFTLVWTSFSPGSSGLHANQFSIYIELRILYSIWDFLFVPVVYRLYLSFFLIENIFSYSIFWPLFPFLDFSQFLPTSPSIQLHALLCLSLRKQMKSKPE